jgi:hypothetical protein
MTAETGDAKSVAAAKQRRPRCGGGNAAAVGGHCRQYGIAMADALGAAQSVLSALDPVSTANATPINTAAVLSVQYLPIHTTTNVAAYNSPQLM